MNIGVSDFVIAIPELYIVLMAFIVLLLGVFNKSDSVSQKVVFFNKLLYINLFVLLSGLCLLWFMGDTYTSTFNGLFVISPSIYIFKIIILLFTILLSIFSRRYLIEQGIFNFEYIIILLLMTFGNMAMLSSDDFISFYVSLELVSIASYILIFLFKNTSTSLEAGIKYFVLGSLGTGFLLYGISLIYGFTGETNFLAIKSHLSTFHDNWLLIVGLVMMLIGLCFKLSLAPFHMWTPDVYKGSAMSVVMLMSTVVKFAVLFVLIRILWEVFPSTYLMWAPIIKLLIIVSAFIGFVVAINQYNIKSFVAYSSIANMSYVLLGVLHMSDISLVNIIIYIFAYGIALIGFLGILLLLKRNDKYIRDIYDLAGLSAQHPYLAFTLSTFIVSMAGLPITAGFWGKAMVLYDGLSLGFFVLSSCIAILSVVIMYYYFKMIKTIYFEKNVTDSVYFTYSAKFGSDVNILILLLFILTIGFMFILNPLSSYLISIVHLV